MKTYSVNYLFATPGVTNNAGVKGGYSEEDARKEVKRLSVDALRMVGYDTSTGTDVDMSVTGAAGKSLRIWIEEEA